MQAEVPHNELLQLAVTAAVEGSRLALSHASTAPESKGAAGDVVTATDRVVEVMLRDKIGRLRPDDRIIGEEMPESGSGDSGIDWYLDPIDGTSNFVLSLEYFCTSVAAYSRIDRRWLVGAVAAEHLGVTYSASAGGGAWLTTRASRTRLRARAPVGAPRLLGVGVSYDPALREHQLSDLSHQMDGFDDLRALGSAALALCLVASGSLAAFIETDLYVHDWAAGALIAEEAGAVVTTPAGLRRGGVSAFGRSAAADR